MMEADAKNLIEVLQQQKGVIAELTDLAGEQLEALKRDDLEQLNRVTARQTYIIQQSAALEEKRSSIMKEFSRQRGVEIGHFSQLKELVSDDEFTRISMLRDELIYNSRKLKDEHELNAILLKQGLQYADKMLEVLNIHQPSGYNKSGNVYLADGNRILDTNI